MPGAGQFYQGDDGQYYVAYCPGAAGSIYYLLACTTNNGFLGCCTNQEGCYNDCDESDYSNFTLSTYKTHVPRSFNSDIQSQRCDTGGDWYSCPEKNFETNYIGCCATNPCTAGCPEGNYTRAFLSANPAAARFFYGLNASSLSFSIPVSTTLSTSAVSSGSSLVPFTSSVGSTSSTTISSSSTSYSSVSYPTTFTGSQVVETASTPGTAVVAGSTVGGVAALLVIVALIAYRVRRKATSRRRHLDNFRVSSLWGGSGERKTENDTAGDDALAEAPPSEQAQGPSELTGEFKVNASMSAII